MKDNNIQEQSLKNKNLFEYIQDTKQNHNNSIAIYSLKF